MRSVNASDVVKFIFVFVFAAASAFAQTNSSPVPATNENLAVLQHVEQLRAQCIQNRRLICGKIVKILPDGIVVDSGYTNLMRPPLNSSWLIPGAASAERAKNFVEKAGPDSICAGLVFVTDLPRPPRGMKVKLFDYVILDGFPMGKYDYHSVGTVQHSIRKFSNKVTTAVRWMYGQEVEDQETANPPPNF